MSLTPIFYGRASANGIVRLERTAQFQAHVRRLAGKEVEVLVRPRRTTRSTPQNNYYWGVVVETLADELGYTKDEMHEALAWKFLKLEAGDARLPTRRSTSSLTTHEFEDYVSAVKVFAATDLGIHVPDPNEVEP